MSERTAAAQTTEAQIRAELNIPSDAQHVIILSMDAHMDWDWNRTFERYYTQGSGVGAQAAAEQILKQAITDVISKKNFKNSNNVNTPYYFSTCEMAWFREYIAQYYDSPAKVDQLKQDLGDLFRIVGGGITSPDNLLPHGEAFIRNYLIGKQWLDSTLGFPMRQAYIPDDFGHQSQLPILLQAMGFQGVSFARIPGSADQSNSAALNNPQSLANQVFQGGVDFVWQASDGSTTVAHWMQAHYSEGQSIASGDDIGAFIDPNAPGGYGPSVDSSSLYDDTTQTANEYAAPTPYMYVPCGDDFMLPISNLQQSASDWNKNYFYNQSDKSKAVFAVVATLDHYIQLVATYADPNAQHNFGPYKNLKTQSFYATPYWTGFYASHPETKILHQAATRELLSAEALDVIANLQPNADSMAWQYAKQAREAAIEGGWQSLAPSTHHDYITGTAPYNVYSGEQVPLLRNALSLARGGLDSGMQEVASLALATPSPDETAVTVYNPLGYEHAGLVEIPQKPGVNAGSVRDASGNYAPVQSTQKGTLLFPASVASLGYGSFYLSPKAITPGKQLSVSFNSSGTECVLSNANVALRFKQSANWGLVEFLVKSTNTNLIGSNQVCNDLVFYRDDNGNNYNFGNETDSNGMFIDPNGKLTPVSADVIEHGELAITVRTVVRFDSNDGASPPNAISGEYIRDYTLTRDADQVIMSTTGAAPLTANGEPVLDAGPPGRQYSVMLRFAFADPGGVNPAVVDNFVHGVPYLWADKKPLEYWQPPIFQATHDFIVPYNSSGQHLAVLQHASIPAWAVDSSGGVLGCILRNTPRTALGAQNPGGDQSRHTHVYAMGPASSGTQTAADYMGYLQQSQQVQRPLVGAYASPPADAGAGTVVHFPAQFSLASITSKNAIISAAKASGTEENAFVLRIYVPKADATPVTVDVAFDPSMQAMSLQMMEITALEEPLDGAGFQPVSNNQFSFKAARALHSFLIKTQ